jgi:hypothetical protein
VDVDGLAEAFDHEEVVCEPDDIVGDVESAEELAFGYISVSTRIGRSLSYMSALSANIDSGQDSCDHRHQPSSIQSNLL